MNRYVLMEIEKKGEEVIELVGGIHLSFSKLHIPIVYIYDEDLKKQVITMKVLKKYQKLLQMITFYFNADDDTGVAYQEILSEIEKFFRMIQNKYHKYLLEVEMEEMTKTLLYLQKSATRKLQILERSKMYQSDYGRGAR